MMLSLSLGALALSDAGERSTVLADGRTTVLAEQLRLLAVHAFVGAGNDVGTPAQSALGPQQTDLQAGPVNDVQRQPQGVQVRT